MLISRKAAIPVALATGAALALAACGSSGKTTTPGGPNTQQAPSGSPSAGGDTTAQGVLNVGAGATDAQSGTNGTHGTTPKVGGTLKLLGAGDVDYLDTADAYYTVSYTLLRAITRQLVTYPTSVDPTVANTPVPDMATAVPAASDGGKTYAFTIKDGVKWNAPSGARQVTGADEVRGIKRLCNPVQPSGGLAYFTGTITGMDAFCGHAKSDTAAASGFAAVAGNAKAIAAYMNSHQISGLTASGNTVTFKLTAPAGDFINIMALPFASPAPVETEKYVPASNDYNQHLISDGPYQVTKYVPAQSFKMDRNPAWAASTDAVRHAYVDNIQVTEGSDEVPVQQALTTGDADLEFDTGVPAANLPALKASGDKHLQIQNVGSTTYLVFNGLSPNAGGALAKPAVRQALQYCVAKNDIVQIEGGPDIAAPIDQILTPPILGYKKIDPYNNLNGQEDVATGKSKLAAAGYPNGMKLTFLFRNKGKAPQIATALQADFAKCGVTANLKQAAPADFYTKYLQNPTSSKAGQWDVAVPGWNPDWQGNAARSFFVPLLDPRTYGVGSTNYGDYGAKVSGLTGAIDSALAATDASQVADKWAALDSSTMTDGAPWIPLINLKIATYTGKNVDNAIFFNFGNNADPTNVWKTN